MPGTPVTVTLYRSLLAPLLFIKLAIAIMSMLNPARANSADAIDVSAYSEAAVREGLLSTALLGLLHLAIGLMGVLAMVRYRAMVPLIYLWLLAEFLGRRVVLAPNTTTVRRRVGDAPPSSSVTRALIVRVHARS